MFVALNIQFINFMTFRKKAFRGWGRKSEQNKHLESNLACFGCMNGPAYISTVLVWKRQEGVNLQGCKIPVRLPVRREAWKKHELFSTESTHPARRGQCRLFSPAKSCSPRWVWEVWKSFGAALQQCVCMGDASDGREGAKITFKSLWLARY